MITKIRKQVAAKLRRSSKLAMWVLIAITFSGFSVAGILWPSGTEAQFIGFSADGEYRQDLMPTGVDSNRNKLGGGAQDPHWGVLHTYNDAGRPTCQFFDGSHAAVTVAEHDAGGGSIRAGLDYQGLNPWAFTSPDARWIGQNQHGRSPAHGVNNPHPEMDPWCYDPGYIGPAPNDTQVGPPGEHILVDNPPHSHWNTFVFEYLPRFDIDPAVDMETLEIVINGAVDDLVGFTVNGEPLDVFCEGAAAVATTGGGATGEPVVQMCAPGLGGNRFSASVSPGTSPFRETNNLLKVYVKSAFSNTGIIITGASIEGVEEGDEGIRAIRGRKVDDDFNMPGPWNDNLVTVQSSGYNNNSNDNPFGFFSLNQTNYTVSVEEEPNHSVRWVYCRLADDGTPNNPRPDGTCSLGGNSTQGNGSSFMVNLTSSIEVRFIFTPDQVVGDPPEHKVFGANFIRIVQQYLRDNEQFPIDVMTYIWPDAGLRTNPPGGDGRQNLWLAGIWGVDAPVPGPGDNASSDSSWRANPNHWTSLNLMAELGCEGNFSACLQRVPAAYVPKDDGSGEPNTAQKDGSRTPNGNRWQPIRDRTLNMGYTERMGGVASNLNMDVGGRTGNYINNIEISNIHIQAEGIDALLRENAAFLQGRIDNDLLQQDVHNLNLPAGSQGPRSNTSPQGINAWDNIRHPGTNLLQGGITAPNLTFNNTGSHGGLPNFTYDAHNIGSNYHPPEAKTYAQMSAVSLLQDGNDLVNPPYTNPSEPLTYTATVDKINQARLRWNEYTEWTQVDNKGHWYTRRGRVATGVDRGPRQGGFNTTVNRIRVINSGSRRNYWYCHERDPWGANGHYHDNQPTSYSPYNHHNSADWNCYIYFFTTPSTYCVSETTVAYHMTTRWYYRHRVDTQYGWLNNSPGRTQQNTNWTRTPSNFFSTTNGQEANATPPWADTGNDHYWQDTSVTAMDNSGSSIKPPHTQRWIHNTTDPTYSNRHVFDIHTPHTFRSGWYKTGSQCISRYPNGSHETYTQSAFVDHYHPSSSLLYEDSRTASQYHVGRYDFEEDGSSDGIVDTGWAWQNNYQRVRYEQTFNNRHRNLGPRSRDGSPEDDDLLYGTDPQRHILAGRGLSTIHNPVIAVSSGDVFAGGNLHSYFQSSRAPSAFLFSNNNITNFSLETRRYSGYHINRNRGRVAAYYPQFGEAHPVDYVFQDINDVSGRGETLTSGNISGAFNLEREGSQKADNVYVRNSDLTIGNATFSGVGTIIVNGNLTINGNMTYANTPVTDRRHLQSLGIIVRGSILISPAVTRIDGSIFSGGVIHTGSVLLNTTMNADGSINSDPTDARTGGDQRLVVNGLMIANNFVLARQQAGSTFQASGPVAEEFNYDGRVVVNPPPGFARVFNADAIWNDTVPRN